MTGTTSQRMDLRGLKALQRRSPAMFAKALERPAIQMLTWMNTGSPRESRTPPIRTGVLRGSGTAFVGGKLVATTPSAGGTPTPAGTSGAPTPLTVHWTYNTDYASKMHERPEGSSWGAFTEQAQDAGSKWMEKHVIADREAFAAFVAKEFKALLAKGVGF